jgi:hypothetical protein
MYAIPQRSANRGAFFLLLVSSCQIRLPEEFRCLPRVKIVCQTSALPCRSFCVDSISEVTNYFDRWTELRTL